MKKNLWLVSEDEQKPKKHLIEIKNDDDDFFKELDSSLDGDFNRIYFYSDVNQHSTLSLNKKIKKLNVDLCTMSMNYQINPPPIHLHISSPGGIILDAFNAIDHIEKSKIPIYSHIDGGAASAATMISVSCHKRFMTKHSYMLIHQLRSGMWGTFHEMKDHINNSRHFMKVIKNIYREKTKIPTKVLNEILKHDLWLDSKQCLKYGLVDEII